MDRWIDGQMQSEIRKRNKVVILAESYVVSSYSPTQSVRQDIAEQLSESQETDASFCLLSPTHRIQQTSCFILSNYYSFHNKENISLFQSKTYIQQENRYSKGHCKSCTVLENNTYIEKKIVYYHTSSKITSVTKAGLFENTYTETLMVAANQQIRHLRAIQKRK